MSENNLYSKYQSILLKSMLFKNIEAGDLNVMLSCLKPKIVSFKRNDFLAIEGEYFDGLGIVLAGSVAIVKENAAGNRVIMDILSTSNMFGEIAAFSNKGIWPATVIAQEACTALFMSPQKIIGTCENSCRWHKLLILNMLSIVSNKALMLNRKVQYLTIKSMRGKICTYLLEQYKDSGNKTFMLSMKRNELADFLNVSRPSMSRELSRMKEEGLIDFHLSSFQIKDVETLKTQIDI